MQPPSQMTIQADACKKGGGAFANDLKTGDAWRSLKKSQHIRILELKAIYLALLTFTKETKYAIVLFQIGNRFTDISSKDAWNSEFRND